jgi:LysM repeat protein
MRVRTRSACVVLAWGILLLLVAVGLQGSLRPAQANTRIAGNTSTISTTTQVTTTSTLTSILASTSTRIPAGTPASTALTSRPTSSAADRPDTAAAARFVPRRARPDTGTPMGTAAPVDTGTRTDTGPRAGTGTYIVQPGDTLSGIAAALGTSGGWPALYAANRQALGPDPNTIRPGTALALPGRGAPARYTVAAGDTLSGIAAALATPGGWPALYAANRQTLGPDPNTIRPGTVIAIPHPAPPAPASAAPRPGGPAPAPAPPSASAQPPAPTTAPTSARPPAPAKAPALAPAPPKATATTGLPRWLQIVLLAAGVLIGTAFVAEPVLALGRRRRQPSRSTARPAPGPAAFPAAKEPRILLADYDRLVVTSSGPDGTVCVLRPPGADPATILVAARLVLAQDRYEELAGHLGMAPPRRQE